MTIVAIERLGMFYGAQDIFTDISADMARGDKVALVGPNGAGKTTLLRIILGLDEPTSGAVHRARGLRIGYLPQRPQMSSGQTLYGEMLAVFADLRRQQEALLELAERLSQASDPTDLMERYAQAEQRFDLAGGYTYENRIVRVLGGLGFPPEQHGWPIRVLSGGQITRALLARLLLEEPELLVLDEPTNYLDLQALEWLESYLADWRQSLLIVSHDRFFLDRVVTRVWEMEHGRLETYRGNYTAYVEQRRARRERQQREYEEQQEEIARTEEFIRRNIAGQRTREAQGRRKRLERVERIERPKETRTMSLRLATTLRAGDRVLSTEGAVIGYPTRPDDAQESGGHQSGGHQSAGHQSSEHSLLSTGEILVKRGQRVALLGSNGSGKTTLLRTMLGEVEPLHGRLRLGASVKIGYLPQTQDWLDPAKKAVEQVMDAGGLRLDEARAHLGRFLFSGDDAFKQVDNLSGGERSRLALAVLTLRGANLLVLDEPTTHLDVPSQEVLQEVLQRFPGTIIMVSHDRYLIDALATHTWIVKDRTIEQYEGNYSLYLALTAAQQAASAEGSRRAEAMGVARDNGSDLSALDSGAVERSVTDRESQRRERRERKELARREQRVEELEGEIARLEEQIAVLSEQIASASAVQDVARVQALGVEYATLERHLAAGLHQWESLLGHDGA